MYLDVDYTQIYFILFHFIYLKKVIHWYIFQNILVTKYLLLQLVCHTRLIILFLLDSIIIFNVQTTATGLFMNDPINISKQENKDFIHICTPHILSKWMFKYWKTSCSSTSLTVDEFKSFRIFYVINLKIILPCQFPEIIVYHLILVKEREGLVRARLVPNQSPKTKF